MSNMDQKSITFKIITEQDQQTILQYLKQYFYDDEPLNQCLKQESSDKIIVNDDALNSTNSINERLSIMAVTPSNQIIGVILNKKVSVGSDNWKKQGENNLCLIKIRKLLYELEEQMANLTKLRNSSEKEMCVTFLTVHPKWRNKGIGYALLEYSRKIAKQNGFNQIRGICTSAYSARILEKNGFNCVHAIKYEDYKENGKVIFKPNSPHTHIKAMVLKI